MTDHDLEERLTALFERRATDIRTAPPLDFSSAPAQRPRVNLTPLAVAASIAAVIVVAGGTVVGIRSVHHSTPEPAASSKLAPISTSGPTPSSRPTTCAEVRARTTWQTPIDNGTKVVLDHPENTVVSVNGKTGDYLLLQATPPNAQSAAVFGQATLAVFHGATGQDIAVLPAGSTDVPTVDAAGAITPDWISYGLAAPQSAGTYHKVVLFNRHSGTSVTVAELSQADQLAGTIFSAPPVIFDGKLYWIRSSYSDRSQSRLESYDLQTGNRDETPVPGAVSLVYYGTGVGVLSGSDPSPTFTVKLGAALPTRVVDLLQGATQLSYDAPAAGSSGSGSLHWTKTLIDRGTPTTAYYTNQVGTAGFDYFETTTESFDVAVGTGPFVRVSVVNGDGAEQVLDTRLGAHHPIPAGTSLQAVVGDTAIFGTGTTKLGAAGLTLVKIAALPTGAAGC